MIMKNRQPRAARVLVSHWGERQTLSSSSSSSCLSQLHTISLDHPVRLVQKSIVYVQNEEEGFCLSQGRVGIQDERFFDGMNCWRVSSSRWTAMVYPWMLSTVASSLMLHRSKFEAEVAAICIWMLLSVPRFD